MTWPFLPQWSDLLSLKPVTSPAQAALSLTFLAGKGRYSGGIHSRWTLVLRLKSCLCRCEVKSKAEQEGHFPLSSFWDSLDVLHI